MSTDNKKAESGIKPRGGRTASWSAATCRRFESADTSAHSTKSHRLKAACALTPVKERGPHRVLRPHPPQSKTWRIFGALLTFLAITISVRAQSYSVDSFKVARGGGTSSNGQYTVRGGFGQHDAGPMSGGNYSLTGNFWAIFVVQTPGAPVLAVTLSGPNTVVVSWPLSATNFVLEQNSDLTTTSWTPSSYPITTNGGMESITITSPPPGDLFFRLRQ
jgi:hypothetical protein